MNTRDSGKIIASILLKTGAIRFQDKEPFLSERNDGVSVVTVTKSPIFIDCQRMLAFPTERNIIIEELKALVENNVNVKNLDTVTGCETGGIAYSAWLAHELSLPLMYVRKQCKSYGTALQIEGLIDEQSSTVLIDDLTFDGASKINFTQALRQENCSIESVFTIFDFNTPKASKRFSQYGLTAYSLTNGIHLLEVAKREKLLSKNKYAIVESYLEDPVNWNPA